MDNSRRINAIALGLATILVFSFWSHQDEIKILLPFLKTKLATTLFASLISVSFYKIIVSLIILLLEKAKFIKRLVLGPMYLQGTWVGYYHNTNGELKYFVERIEQDVYNNRLMVNGYARSEDNQIHATWEVICSKIDVKMGKYYYMYQVDPANKKGTNRGLSELSFIRKDEKSAPTAIHGYAIDAHEVKKTYSWGRKVSEDLDFDDDMAFREAQKYYLSKKG